ncbi:MAG: efflux RND transporter periplasmic adaptor subunit [Deltaproteobacteria bacterium HGW-Deltaproteobacteria-19]|jgi:RND family efflux transporter MFP subunit|nr:MAG: efflux RND transporter periplasmic adaptor subunit [Deltaproteobacteria bacterium HGW-Deltaproteobacteria-19]
MAQDDLSGLKIDKTLKKQPLTGSRKWTAAAVVAVLLVGASVLYALGVLTPSVTVETAAVSQVYPSQGLTVLNASGYVVAQRRAAVASKATGRLVALLVEEGSRVRKGQVIARLENEDVLASKDQATAGRNVARANLDQVRAEQEEAKRDYGRNRRLVETGAVSRSAYDLAETRMRRAEAVVAAAEASLKSAEAGVRGAETALDYTQIKAPFDAVVLTKNADIGDIVTPLGAAANAKAAVVTIADLGSLLVEVDVSESNIGRVKQGQPCEISLDALPETRFAGEVHAIVPTVDRSKASVMVKVRFLKPGDRLLPDMSAKVAFLSRPIVEGDEKPRLAVHRTAVLEKEGRRIVFVVRGDRAKQATIQTGTAALGDMIEVTGGIQAGERVILKPQGRLRDGARIKVAEK